MLDDEISIPYPEPGNTLIQEGGGAEAKVLFADWMEGKWDLYADGYKAAADMLVDQLQGVPPEDRLICPLVFIYRHFVELRLKSLVIGLSRLKNKPLEVFHTHNILVLWRTVKGLLGVLASDNFKNDIINSLESLISELNALDPDSMHFRYSHSRNLDQFTLPRSVSMAHFKTTMDKIANGLSYIEIGIDLEQEGRANVEL